MLKLSQLQTTTLLTLFILFLASSAYAQGGMRQQPTLEDQAARLTNAMTQLLELGDERKAEVHDINLEYLKGAQKMQESGSASPQQSQKLFETRQKKLSEALTPQQFQTLKAEQQKQRQRMQQRRQQMREQQKMQEQPGQQQRQQPQR